jgi:hypothetical protein
MARWPCLTPLTVPVSAWCSTPGSDLSVLTFMCYACMHASSDLARVSTCTCACAQSICSPARVHMGPFKHAAADVPCLLAGVPACRPSNLPILSRATRLASRPGRVEGSVPGQTTR